MSLDNESTFTAQESALGRVQRIYETQDAELRRIRDEREAREVPGQSDLDKNLNPEWAELDAADRPQPEVEEMLGELGIPSAQDEARQALIKAAIADLERIRRRRESRQEATTLPRFSDEPPLTQPEIDEMLADLSRSGAESITAEPVTPKQEKELAEFDAQWDAAFADFEASEAKAAADAEIQLTPSEPVTRQELPEVADQPKHEPAGPTISHEPNDLISAIKAYRARQPAAKARIAACEEFGVDPVEPFATEKIRVARRLKRDGLTLADLYALHPDFWNLPHETHDGSSSRKLVLTRFLYRRADEIKAGKNAIERQKKRTAKIAAKGWRPDYDDLSPKARKRERDRIAKQNSRARAEARKAAGCA